MKRIIILDVTELIKNRVTGELRDITFDSLKCSSQVVAHAEILIIKDPYYFICLKNRHDRYYGDTIPLFILKPFLLRYRNNFLVEDFLEALL